MHIISVCVFRSWFFVSVFCLGLSKITLRSPEFYPLILTALLLSQGLDPVRPTVTVPAPHLLALAIVGFTFRTHHNPPV